MFLSVSFSFRAQKTSGPRLTSTGRQSQTAMNKIIPHRASGAKNPSLAAKVTNRASKETNDSRDEKKRKHSRQGSHEPRPRTFIYALHSASPTLDAPTNGRHPNRDKAQPTRRGDSPDRNGLADALPGAPTAGPSIVLRSIHQPRNTGRVIQEATYRETLRAALDIDDFNDAEPVLEWSGTDQLAVLDVDYHDVEMNARPNERQLALLARQVRPQPAFSWRSHGRGLHLVYVAVDGFTAAEIAAVAGLSVKGLDSSCSIEIKSETRHPRYPRAEYPDAGVILENDQLLDLVELGRLLGREVDEQAVDDWLAEQGLERGRRYEHDRCPCDPSTESHGEPVVVDDDGIFCHRCAAMGLTLAGSRVGFFPFGKIIGGGFSPVLLRVVKNFTHWEHAKIILEAITGLTDELAKLVYSAALKLCHGSDDPRIGEFFYRGWGLVRATGYWTTPDLNRPHAKDGLKDRLAALPAVKFIDVNDDGEKTLRVAAEKLAILRGIDDLAEYGYPAISPLRGMRVGTHWISPPHQHTIPKVVVPIYLKEAAAAFRPKYLSACKRLSEDDAFVVLERATPGINRNYLKLLIAARGYMELGVGPPAMIVVTGPTGAAKSMTVTIAAMLLGDEARSLRFNGDGGKLHEALFEASRAASFVKWDEFAKNAKDKFGRVVPNLTPLLQYARGQMVRLNYIGNVPIDQSPVIVLTDINIPDDVLQDRQLGRRFVHVHLDRRVDWDNTAKNIETWRADCVENAHAANSIISCVIDEFFAGPTMSAFNTIARCIGFCLLCENHDPDFDPRIPLLRLFRECCNAARPDAKNSTYKGRGWKLVHRDRDDGLKRAWLDVCDDIGPGFTSSRRVKETDLAELLGTPNPVELDIRPHGNLTLGLRFREGDFRARNMLVNDEIQVAPDVAAQITSLDRVSEKESNRPPAPSAAEDSANIVTEELI